MRAYDIGAFVGDSGYPGTAEVRHDLGESPVGRWQALAFLDSAHLKMNHRPWAAGDNRASLRGAGAGISLTEAGNWQAGAYVATPVGATPAE